MTVGRADIRSACNRAIELHQAWRLDEAQAIYEEILRVQPRHFDALHLLGTVHAQTSRPKRGAELIRKALAIEPTNAAAFSAYTNLGSALAQLNQLTEAVTCYNRAIGLRPDYVPAYHNRAFARLALGDMEHGWVDYEWRWKERADYTGFMRAFGHKLWSGADSIAGKTIVLHSEQGLGDTLQFCRYAGAVANAGGKVILVVQKPLLQVARTLDGPIEVRAEGDELPAFDFYCPLMSLPLGFKTSVGSIPGGVPYLHVDQAKASVWAHKLGPKSRPRVGLVWSGGFRADRPDLKAVNERRNIPLAGLSPLFRLNCDFYSLQKGEPAESELADLMASGWAGRNLIDHTGSLADFSDTAALIEQMDLVISVDTSTAHLAGALGKPVWIINRFDACWRWLLNRHDSPWYPTARIYRQDAPGAWEPVIDRVVSDLAVKFP